MLFCSAGEDAAALVISLSAPSVGAVVAGRMGFYKDSQTIATQCIGTRLMPPIQYLLSSLAIKLEELLGVVGREQGEVSGREVVSGRGVQPSDCPGESQESNRSYLCSSSALSALPPVFFLMLLHSILNRLTVL